MQRRRKTSEDRGSEATLFRRPGGAELETAHPLIRAALKTLWSHWPAAVSFETLLATARAAATQPKAVGHPDTRRCGDPRRCLDESLPSRLSANAGFSAPKSLTWSVSGRRPADWRDFSWSVASLPPASFTYSMKFPDPLSRRLVQLLDGTRDQEMLVRELMEFVRSGRGKVLENSVPVENLSEVAVILNVASLKGSSRWRGRECW